MPVIACLHCLSDECLTKMQPIPLPISTLQHKLNLDNLSTGYAFLADGFELVVGDIVDPNKLVHSMKRVEAVMHFAAHAYVGESVENLRKYFRNNVEGGLSLLNTALDCGVRNLIFSSSCAVYGTPSKIPISEELAILQRSRGRRKWRDRRIA